MRQRRAGRRPPSRSASAGEQPRSSALQDQARPSCETKRSHSAGVTDAVAAQRLQRRKDLGAACRKCGGRAVRRPCGRTCARIRPRSSSPALCAAETLASSCAARAGEMDLSSLSGIGAPEEWRKGKKMQPKAQSPKPRAGREPRALRLHFRHPLGSRLRAGSGLWALGQLWGLGPGLCAFTLRAARRQPQRHDILLPHSPDHQLAAVHGGDPADDREPQPADDARRCRPLARAGIREPSRRRCCAPRAGRSCRRDARLPPPAVRARRDGRRSPAVRATPRAAGLRRPSFRTA